MELYNDAVKKKFIEQFKKEEQPQLISIFRRGAELEEYLKKDIYDFNSKEILEFLTLLNRATLSSIMSCWSHITKYIDWAIYQKITKGTTNLSRDLTIDDVKNCVDEGKKLYITADEFLEIMNTLVNPRDRAMMVMLYEGIQGFKCSEILNLKKKDVEKAMENDNILTVHDDKHGSRDIKVSDQCLKICLEAANEPTYQKKNGYSEANNKEVILADNDYVIRNRRTNSVKDEVRTSFFVITNTMRYIFSPELFDYPYLNPTRINRSGVLYEGYKIYKDKGRLETEDYIGIINKRSERYNDIHKKVYKIKEYLNEDEIKKYYAKELGIKDSIRMR
ncbi:phage lytic cycle repressor MrpR family protein [Bacillus swezeyi]|uniref:phage lytic cycle repressor MrpR family protein n=1 Tax=Bacillus swezeyi TaxID=1925020 RepID=UPI00123A20C7|nr:site-specific integrase [Bacillus swezeyi]KAA6472206.1 site-specific integrase [Bacillus swezeyi]